SLVCIEFEEKTNSIQIFIAVLETYLSAIRLKNYELTDEEQEAVNEFEQMSLGAYVQRNF
ncbi:MAG: hypothetical protein RSB35_10660, partial [Eubacterium sp.]